LRLKGLVRPEVDALIGLPERLVYADDTDFVSSTKDYLVNLMKILSEAFPKDFM